MPLGIECKTYRNTATYGSPTWSEITLISDFTLDPTWDTVEALTRESRIKRMVTTLLALETSGKILVRKTDSNYSAFVTAFYAQSMMDLLILDASKDVAGAEGVRGEFYISKLTDEQGPATLRYRDFTIVPALSENAFSRATTGGSPVVITYSSIPA